ncbi:MAG: TolC family protein [Pseudomonadota bacterium]|nr:TolC family protein [Pseudomonadota bacterium]
MTEQNQTSERALFSVTPASRLLLCALALPIAVGCKTAPEYQPPEPQSTPGPSALQRSVQEQATEYTRFSGPPIIEDSGQGALEVSREQAVMLALKNNRLLAIQTLTPMLRGAFEDIERSRYDVNLFAQASYGKDKSQFFFPGVGTIPEGLEFDPRPSFLPPFLSPSEPVTIEGGAESLKAERGEAEVGLSKRFVTGTQVDVSVSSEVLKSQSDTIEELILEDLDVEAGDQQSRFRVGLTLTQALLRGGSPTANLARIRQTEVESLASAYQLRGFTQSLVAQTESLYWDYFLFKRRIEILEDSVAVSEKQLGELEKRVQVGQIAETQLPAARAELAFRRQALIEARSGLERLRLRFLQIMNPESLDGWDRRIEILDTPTLPPAIEDSVEDHIKLGLRLRPDLNEARLQLQSGELQVVQTKNGLLPLLNLFINLGKSGYADSFSDSVDSFSDGDENYYDIGAGIRLDYPLRNRQARAIHTQAVTSRNQRELALQNLEQSAELDVRSAYLEVERAREQVNATGITRRFQEEAVRAERENFRVGRTTSSVVTRVERDLFSAEVDEVRAIVDLRKAMIELYRQDGSLLQRRGITTPGTDASASYGLPAGG